MESTEAPQGSATVGTGHLLTPETPTIDNFSRNKTTKQSTTLPVPSPHSPPASPEQPLDSHFDQTTLLSRDRQLFSDTDSLRAALPLFDSQRSFSDASSTSHETPDKIRVPGTIIEIDRTREAAAEYLKQRIEDIRRLQDARRQANMLPIPRPSAVEPRDAVTRRQLSKLSRPAPVPSLRTSRKRTHEQSDSIDEQISYPPGRQSSHAPDRMPAMTLPHSPAPTGKVAKQTRTPRMKREESVSPDKHEDKKHKRAGASKKGPSKEEDEFWRDLPDYSPTITEAELNSLIADWDGAPLDISKEKDFAELKGAEVKLCRTLRLLPVSYLANKRRMFAAKVEAEKQGKTFTKTAAQNVTNIDVNKASKMWEAFNGVEWWLPERYARFLSGSAG